MPTPNQSPIFTKVPNIGAVSPSAGNTKSDGTGTIGSDMFVAFTAGPNGSWVERIRISPTASVANTSMTATVGRVFISSKVTGATTAADTHLWDEVTLPAITADASTGQVQEVEAPLAFALPPNYTLLVSNHVAPAANTGWRAVVTGGDY